MKKLIALIVVIAFVVGLVGMASAATSADVRAYIGTLNQKLVVAKANKNWTRVAKLKQMIAVQETRLAAMTTTSTPVAVPPPPVQMSAAPMSAGLFGMGLDTAYAIGYIADKSVISLRGDVILADPLGLGPIVGLPAESVKYRVGLGYTQGNDTNDNTWKSIPLYVDGLIMLPADVLGGIESYLGGGINYVVYRTGQTSGSLGGEIYYGIQGDIGLGGKSFAQVGYTILRTGSVTTGTAYSTKGIGIEVGTSLVL